MSATARAYVKAAEGPPMFRFSKQISNGRSTLKSGVSSQLPCRGDPGSIDRSVRCHFDYLDLPIAKFEGEFE
ncbi:MAG: hypothetical protein M3198_01710, partial [Actinomycetota bacterium]|nr:hypothetical protein [Actinomycetota bacterium]